MPARANLIPSYKLTTNLPLDVFTKLSAHLYSDLEGRVPKGAFADFFSERIREYFTTQGLDLAPYNGVNPGVFYVRATPESITELRRLLEKA